MLPKFRQRMESEKGFTLIELLVVILIIGILAAIALPAFLGQRTKGQDGEAKSNVRNVVSHMESCFTQKETYTGCSTAVGGDVLTSGIPIGTGSGKVAITLESDTGYVLTGKSKSATDFVYTKAGATATRTCTVNKGGCNGTSW